jgi:hypothetical protein
MLKNQAKSHWTLEELGWVLYEPGDLKDWDGLTQWFLDYVDIHKEVLDNAYLKRWNNAARAVKRI